MVSNLAAMASNLEALDITWSNAIGTFVWTFQSQKSFCAGHSKAQLSMSQKEMC